MNQGVGIGFVVDVESNWDSWNSRIKEKIDNTIYLWLRI